jgi:hypothetical protein
MQARGSEAVPDQPKLNIVIQDGPAKLPASQRARHRLD